MLFLHRKTPSTEEGADNVQTVMIIGNNNVFEVSSCILANVQYQLIVKFAAGQIELHFKNNDQQNIKKYVMGGSIKNLACIVYSNWSL